MIEDTLKNVYFGLRSKQKETFDACLKEKYGIIKDTCGTGKSRIEFELIANAITKNEKIIVFAAHRLDLIKQHEDNFTKYIEEFHNDLINGYRIIEISSAKRNNISSYSKIPDIRNTIDGIIKPTIFFVCYASLNHFYSAIKNRKDIDLMICDEAHYGMSNVNENDTNIDKYDFIQLSKSFLCFTATPYDETMTSDKMKVIHDFTYSEAVNDNLILPMHVEFYRANDGSYDANTRFGMITEAYNNLKENFKDTAAKLLVCGTGLEENQIIFNSLIKDSNIKNEILNGSLAIVKVGSTSYNSKDEEIPSCEFIDYTNCENYIPGNGKLNQDNDTENKLKVIDKIHEWTENVGNIHHNIIIIHCQMLGVGIDLPNLNGICILGNKETSDLYQSIMRGCRIANFDRNKIISERIEKYFKVYIHCYDDVIKELKEFIEKLFTIGGIDLLKAIIFSNELTSSIFNNQQISTMAKILLDKIIKEKEVTLQYEFEYKNSKNELAKIINEYLKNPSFEYFITKIHDSCNELLKKYPEESQYINEQYQICEKML